MTILKEPVAFEWDQGNKGKNFEKHGVTDEECEEVFFDEQKKLLKDIIHSAKESRHILLGRTKSRRVLFLVFTLRKNRVRVISARDTNKKERYLYEEKN